MKKQYSVPDVNPDRGCCQDIITSSSLGDDLDQPWAEDKNWNIIG